MKKFMIFAIVTTLLFLNFIPAANAASQWAQVGPDWVLLNEQGERETGWHFINGRWYYLDAEGIMKRGWFKDVDGSWYFLENSGAMKTGWHWDGSNWYHFNGSGRMITGWIYTGGSWFYLRENGMMISDDVLLDGGCLYFLDGDGRMKVGEVKINGENFSLLSDGSFNVAAALENFSRKYVLSLYLMAEISAKENNLEKVWVTENGMRYHKEFCKTLEFSNTLIFSRNAATELGYTPCKICCP